MLQEFGLAEEAVDEELSVELRSGDGFLVYSACTIGGDLSRRLELAEFVLSLFLALCLAKGFL